MASAVRVEVCLAGGAWARQLRADARRGLLRRPREMPPKWLYDDRGSSLFEEITRLPEYYPTRREREILLANRSEIAWLTRAETLVELGSGTSEKTRILLSALGREGTLQRFCPLDVSERTLRASAAQVAAEHGGLAVHAVVGDFERHLHRVPRGGRRLIAFLGGTLGNLKPRARAGFLRTLARVLGPTDCCLLGTDLVKDRSRLEAAYNDSRGVTAAFNLNLLNVLNHGLGAEFDVAGFEHVARFDPAAEWIEMFLRARRRQRVRVARLGRTLSFEAGELFRTEVSAKFRPERLERELAQAGLGLVRFFLDDAGDFALSLVRAV